MKGLEKWGKVCEVKITHKVGFDGGIRNLNSTLNKSQGKTLLEVLT